MSDSRDFEGAPPRQAPDLGPAGRNVISVIGINRYVGWPHLGCAVGDALGARSLFQRLGFEEVVPPLLDEHATGQAMESLVTDDLTVLGPDDNLVLFYAGHGGTRTQRLGNSEIKTGYLIPVDARSAPNRVATWIELNSWLRCVATLPPKHILVILDACYSGIALSPVIRWSRDAGASPAPLAAVQARRSRLVITSALDDERALDSGPEPGHSLFTGCLIEALTGGLRGDVVGNHRRVITGTDLGHYVRQRVQTYPGAPGWHQTPDFGRFDFDDRGDMVIPLVEESAATSSPSNGSSRNANTATTSTWKRLLVPGVMAAFAVVLAVGAREFMHEPAEPRDAGVIAFASDARVLDTSSTDATMGPPAPPDGSTRLPPQNPASAPEYVGPPPPPPIRGPKPIGAVGAPRQPTPNPANGSASPTPSAEPHETIPPATQPASGTVAVTSDVDDAEVYIDDRKQPSTRPTVMAQAMAGFHIIKVTRPPVRSWEQKILVKKNERTDVRAELLPDIAKATSSSAFSALWTLQRSAQSGIDSDLKNQFDTENVIRSSEDCLAGLAVLKSKSPDRKLTINGQAPMALDDVRDKVCKPALHTLEALLRAQVDEIKWPDAANVTDGAALKAATLAWWKAPNESIVPAYRVENAELVATVVTGDWVSGQDNQLGETTRWDLPVWVALTNATWRKKDVAIVFECWMLTEQQRGVKQGLPFKSVLVTTPSFKIRLSKVKK